MKYRIILILVALLVWSCSKDDGFRSESEDVSEIGFSTYVSNSSKALEKSSFIPNDKISVYAFSHTGELGQQQFEPNKLNAEDLTYDGTIWDYKNSAYWPNNGNKVSFFSIYPSTQKVQFNNGVVSATMTIKEAANEQIDFMWAGMPNRIAEDGKVPFVFNHTLSKITFNAILDKEYPNTTITITEISIPKVFKTGTYTLDQTLESKGKWNNLTTPTIFSPLGSGEEYNVTTTNTQIGASMLLIPQDTHLAKTPITITYDIKYGSVASQPESVLKDQKTVFIPANTWDQNINFIYNLVFSLESVNFSVVEDIIDWNTSGPENPVIVPDDNNKPNVVSFIGHTKGTANSYILNPTAKGGDNTFFLIPIADRINTFWTEYEKVPENRIEIGTTGLTTEVLSAHSENESEPLNLKISFIDTKDMTDINEMGLIIDVPAGASGNAVVAVKKNGLILWSWHLWITDYNPDFIVESNKGKIIPGKYIYTNNGQDAVHRYKDAAPEYISDLNHFKNGEAENPWKTIYKNKFIMDRNLGALQYKKTGSNSGLLYYQYGRKDPFCNSQKCSETKPESRITTINGAQTYAYSVTNPKTLITTKDNNWCTTESYNGKTYPWNDNKLNDKFKGKSFFDPSPLGWKIPTNGAFSDFKVSGWREEDYRYYSNIIFLKDGYLYHESGTQLHYDTIGSYWSSSPAPAESDKGAAYLFDFGFYGGTPSIEQSFIQPYLATAESVRCIME